MVFCGPRLHGKLDSTLHSFGFQQNINGFSQLASHTRENIATLITTCLNTWSIKEKLVCIVRDNGSNFAAGLRNANLPNIPCLAHTLQLVIDNGVLAQPCVVNLLAASRRLVGHFKRSNVNLHAPGSAQHLKI